MRGGDTPVSWDQPNDPRYLLGHAELTRAETLEAPGVLDPLALWQGKAGFPIASAQLPLSLFGFTLACYWGELPGHFQTLQAWAVRSRAETLHFL